jgi:hypothetical protein
MTLITLTTSQESLQQQSTKGQTLLFSCRPQSKVQKGGGCSNSPPSNTQSQHDYELLHKNVSFFTQQSEQQNSREINHDKSFLI